MSVTIPTLYSDHKERKATDKDKWANAPGHKPQEATDQKFGRKSDGFQLDKSLLQNVHRPEYDLDRRPFRITPVAMLRFFRYTAAARCTRSHGSAPDSSALGRAARDENHTSHPGKARAIPTRVHVAAPR